MYVSGCGRTGRMSLPRPNIAATSAVETPRKTPATRYERSRSDTSSEPSDRTHEGPKTPPADLLRRLRRWRGGSRPLGARLAEADQIDLTDADLGDLAAVGGIGDPDVGVVGRAGEVDVAPRPRRVVGHLESAGVGI